jgi:uncharacterized alkaline shock family protein YloU
MEEIMAVDTMTNKPRIEMPVRGMTKTSDIVSDLGTTSIADGVVAKIAGIAAREIEGVHQLVPTGAMASLQGLAQRLSRVDQRATGVAAEVGQKEAAIDLAVELEYGSEIHRVCDAVRRNVALRIETMTGLRVKEVNILVADLFFAADEVAPNRRVE